MNAVKIIPLGGLGEIGMNCMILESQNCILVIDCGILFSDLEQFGVEYVIPDFSYLKERKDLIRAYVITHGHEDHIGALPFAFAAGLQAPIYASHFTNLLIREKMKDYGYLNEAELHNFCVGTAIDFGAFQVTPERVNHSIVDAMALMIDTPQGRIVHTGDFKIDPAPFLGESMDLMPFGRSGDQGVRLLLSDSTNVERESSEMSESLLYNQFEALFVKAQGLTIVSLFASNVERMAQIFHLARKMNKKIALAGRSMEQNVRLALESGFLAGVEDLIVDLSQIKRLARNKIIVLSTGSQGEHRSALIRMANHDHPYIHLREDDLCILSSKFIPGNEKAIGRLINQLFKQGAQVVYEAVHQIHVSGHATRSELQKMIELTRPEFFMPVHGEYRHLVLHAKLAQGLGYQEDQVQIAVNGQILELNDSGFARIGELNETRVLVEGRDGQDVSKVLLKERRQLGEKGVVFSIIVRDVDSRRILAGPEILARGLVDPEREVQLLVSAKNHLKKIVKRYTHSLVEKQHELDVQEDIRLELRRFFLESIGKKPPVLSIILDM